MRWAKLIMKFDVSQPKIQFSWLRNAELTNFQFTGTNFFLCSLKALLFSSKNRKSFIKCCKSSSFHGKIDVNEKRWMAGCARCARLMWGRNCGNPTSHPHLIDLYWNRLQGKFQTERFHLHCMQNRRQHILDYKTGNLALWLHIDFVSAKICFCPKVFRL